uniref:Cytochrome c oxidase polypeptide II n=1 Tax=Solanum lycopersicum TaxID=4081 RepID=A0A3Q7GM82_SOLLC
MVIRISRRRNTYNAKNNILTLQCLFLRYSNFFSVSWILGRALWHFHYKKIQSRKGLLMELLSRFFGPYFLVSSLCSLLYHHLLWYTQWTSLDEQSLNFDNYTIREDDLELGQSIDNRVVLPAKSPICFIVTSADVPHSWVLPSLGVKRDVIPGHLNETSISVQRKGVYYCHEICGTNHAFMPIIVEAVPRKDYGSRVSNQLIPQSPNKKP